MAAIMLAMFRLAKRPTPGLVLLLLVPAFLIFSYFSLASKRSEHEPNFDLDHDGLQQQVTPEE